MRYKLLGYSGLKVSELALGAMTFGQDWGWGSSEEESQHILDTFLEAGGNFVDTASIYTDGTSERYLGRFLQKRRERVVLATKYSGWPPTLPNSDANASGNSRKNLIQTVEASLRNLQTDYIDVLYVHAWDYTTPIEEVMRALDDLVRAGKVLYPGISDTPAWIIARANTLAEVRGWSPFIVTQVEYNLIERASEREILPMARALDLGVTAWSPLAGGLLTGKYNNTTPQEGKPRRLDLTPEQEKHDIRRERVFTALKEVAEQMHAAPAQVALAWLRQRSIIPIIGARTLTQLQNNLESVTLTLPDEAMQQLHEASSIELGFPHEYVVQPMPNRTMYGGMFGLLDHHRIHDLPENLRSLTEKQSRAARHQTSPQP